MYHYHTKLTMKEAHTGGSFVWHQDYGYVITFTFIFSYYSCCYCSYWYQNTCLFPDLASVFIAIDKADVENGCLKVEIHQLVSLFIDACVDTEGFS